MTFIVLAKAKKGRKMSQPPYHATQIGQFGAAAVGDEVTIEDDKTAYIEAIDGRVQTPSVNGRGVNPDYEEPIDATGATAGSPGSFTPSGATVPVDLAALDGVVADPTTAWEAGQHVVLGDESQAYWTGSAWASGSAPA